MPGGAVVNFYLVVLVGLILIFALVMAAMKDGSKKTVPVKRKDFMTRSELEFWRLLVPAASPLNGGPQVAMSAPLTTETGLEKSDRTSARNSFDRKCVDFVLFDGAGVVQLIVELDDSTHKADKDSSRDKLTDSADYRTLRVWRRDAASADALGMLIKAKLAPLSAV
jgi:hypothetical protein